MKTKWYYQTKDFKFHTLKNVEKIEEILTSENKMKMFFDNKICIGCQLKKNFIEILFDKKELRVSINSKDDFIKYTSYSDVITIFNKEYFKLLNSKKNEHNKKSFVDILYTIGLIFTFFGLILDFIFLRFNDQYNLAKEIVPTFEIIAGIGLVLTFPKSLKDFNEENGSDLVNVKGIIGSVTGVLLIVSGILWMLI